MWFESTVLRILETEPAMEWAPARNGMGPSGLGFESSGFRHMEREAARVLPPA